MSKDPGSELFKLEDYRPYLRAWARARGRGEFRRISMALRIHSTLMSQIVNGRKCFTEEQAADLCAYMGLNAVEADYVLKLVQIERAGTPALKNLYRRHLEALRSQARHAMSRVPEAKPLSEEDRAVFYSSWQYSLIRLLTSIESFQTPEAIASRLDLPLHRVREILQFLESRGLCEIVVRGKYRRAEKNTHVEATAALAVRHHQNWRARAMDLSERLGPKELAFTAPVSLAAKDFTEVREILLQAISRIAKLIEKSPAEEVAYLGIDWMAL